MFRNSFRESTECKKNDDLLFNIFRIFSCFLGISYVQENSHRDFLSDRFLRKYASTQKGSLGHGLGASRMYTLPERCYPTRCVIAERREALRVTPRGRPLVDGLPRASSNRKFVHKIKDF